MLSINTLYSRKYWQGRREGGREEEKEGRREGGSVGGSVGGNVGGREGGKKGGKDQRKGEGWFGPKLSVKKYGEILNLAVVPHSVS